MKIILLFTAFNGLSQSVFTRLLDLNHQVKLCLASDEAVLRAEIADFEPDIIICPFLKQRIAEDIWRDNVCIIIHPGIKGDRGPSSLDWSILSQKSYWGVTALQADSEMDAGDIWASDEFAMPALSCTTKASLYRSQVTRSALTCIEHVLQNFSDIDFVPRKLDYTASDIKGQLLPPMAQAVRQIDWDKDTSETVLRKINCGDSFPGVKDRINDLEVYLFNAHKEGELRADRPKQIIAQRQGAICISTIDGAIWIGHLKQAIKVKACLTASNLKSKTSIKLPAVWVLQANNLMPKDVVELNEPSYLPLDVETFHEIRYQRMGDIGFLHFECHNGAMGTSQCERLLRAYKEIIETDVKAVVLMGGREFWSNGIHLNHIEHSEDPALESWANINGINDLVEAIHNTKDKLTVAGLGANAGAGGVMMALACDKVISRETCIFNPHYKTMGLFGSEYWTYNLPRRVGADMANQLVEDCLPINANRALDIGMVDKVFDCELDGFTGEILDYLTPLLCSMRYPSILREKQLIREKDEKTKPLASYRRDELFKMKLCFSNDDYHELRRQFVYKACQLKLPAHLIGAFSLQTIDQSRYAGRGRHVNEILFDLAG